MIELIVGFVLVFSSAGKLDKREFMFFLTGGVGLQNDVPNPDPSWLTKRMWDEICCLDSQPAFSGFLDSFISSVKVWQKYYDVRKPVLPHPWNELLSPFQKLILVRIFQTDKLIECITKLIEKEMGLKYVTPPTFDIANSYDDSSCLCPLIFILSPGADPMAALRIFANKMGYSQNFQSISLGQGQGPIAQAVVEQAQREGQWVCLQNCHLAVSWMPALEKIWENMNTGNTHINFRLWLTSYPSDKFPSSILQFGVKMTSELPTGLKQRLLHSYVSDPVQEPAFFHGCQGNQRAFTKLLYALLLPCSGSRKDTVWLCWLEHTIWF